MSCGGDSQNSAACPLSALNSPPVCTPPTTLRHQCLRPRSLKGKLRCCEICRNKCSRMGPDSSQKEAGYSKWRQVCLLGWLTPFYHACPFVRLKAQLKARLLESQWQKDLTTACQAVLLERGLQNVTVEELVEATQQRASDAVTPAIRASMMEVSAGNGCERREQDSTCSDKGSGLLMALLFSTFATH
jgi:hypothetical protein